MGARGPKPQPSALKLERGNPGHRPINQEEPLLAPAPREVPKRLTGRAKVEWVRLVDELVDKGVLTVADLYSFERYCVLVGLVEKYEALIQKAGPEEAHRLGYSGYLLKLETQRRSEGTQLGLTPSSRSTIKAVKPIKADPAKAKRDRFFGGKPA